MGLGLYVDGPHVFPKTWLAIGVLNLLVRIGRLVARLVMPARSPGQPQGSSKVPLNMLYGSYLDRCFSMLQYVVMSWYTLLFMLLYVLLYRLLFILL